MPAIGDRVQGEFVNTCRGDCKATEDDRRRTVLERGVSGFLANLESQLHALFGGCNRGYDLVTSWYRSIKGLNQIGSRVRPIHNGRFSIVLAEPGLCAVAGIVDVGHPKRKADRTVGGG